MRTPHVLLRSALIALGLMLGHGIWASIGVRAGHRAMALHAAYFDTEAEVSSPVVDDSVRSYILSGAHVLWTSWVGPQDYIAWSPAWLIARFVALTALTFTVWCIAVWIVRVIACRGVSRLSTSLDLTTEQRVVPPWRAIAISPLFGLLSAVSMAFTYTLATAYGVVPWIGDYPRASSPEHVGWTVALTFSTLFAFVWAVVVARVVRTRQASDHGRGVSCSRCGYTFGRIATTTCPECGATPPPLPPSKVSKGRSAWARTVVATLVLATVLAALAGAGASRAVPSLIRRAFDVNTFTVREGVRVNVPLYRPVVVHGPWGAIYFAAVPVETTGQTILRVVHVPNDVGLPTQIVTHVIDAQGTTTPPATNFFLAGVRPLYDSGHCAWVFNRSFADPTTRFVNVSRFADRPERITALPREHDALPQAIREILDGYPTEGATVPSTARPN